MKISFGKISQRIVSIREINYKECNVFIFILKAFYVSLRPGSSGRAEGLQPRHFGYWD